MTSERALIYVRQSVARPGETADTSLSLDSQESACRAYCARQGLEIVEPPVRDHDLKGDDPDREGMRKLMDRARRRDMDTVVVFAMSRFARDSVYQEITWRELRRLAVRVESLNEPNIEHTLIRGMLGVVNQYRSEEIAQHVAAAIRKNAARGVWHGYEPFGYRRDANRRLVIVPEEAAIVRTIFERFSEGWSVADLRRWLNSDATIPPRRRGGRWSVGAVWNALHAEVYRGAVVIEPSVSGGSAFAGLAINNAHEAIVPADIWERVRRRLGDGRPASRSTKIATHWLEGHVYCACGEPMYFVARRNRPNRLWQCRADTLFSNGVRAQPCPEPRSLAGAGWVERGTVALLASTLARAGTVPDDQLRRAIGKPDKRGEVAAKELADLRRQEQYLVDSLAHGVAPQTIAPRLATIAGQIAAAERTVAAFAPTRTLDDLRTARAYAAGLAGALAGTPQQVRAMAERLGLKVIVEPAEWRVTLSFGPEFSWLGDVTRAGKRGKG